MFGKKCCECSAVVITVAKSNSEWMGNETIKIEGSMNRLMASRIINAVAKKAGFDLVLNDLHYNSH